MFKYAFLLIIMPLLLLCSCSNIDKTANYTNSPELAYQLIRICVDKTIQTSSDFYLIDLTCAKELNQQGKEKFLRLRQNIHETNMDSLVSYDSTWIKYRSFTHPIIFIGKILQQSDGTIVIHTSETTGQDGAIFKEIILKRFGNGYWCVKNRMTGVS